MEKIVEQGLLYDFYGELLTERQRQIYEEIVYENLSLGEIAAEQGISRQGVHDIVKRCDKALMEYESRLGLVSRFMKMKERIREIDELTGLFEQNEIIDKSEYCRKVRQISAKIMEEL
ncbi:MAG: DNA-binding protein [Lachnospiraceae bacterium]|nr:DNA-binding protein [Lachnospiraceae bacterium]